MANVCLAWESRRDPWELRYTAVREEEEEEEVEEEEEEEEETI